LKVLASQPQQLLVTYWGSDVGRTFDVLIDGQKIATQRLDRNRPDQFFDETYPIPADLLKEKATITVRFQGRDRGTAGGVFGCRVLKQP
jgi:hypothetical protein